MDKRFRLQAIALIAALVAALVLAEFAGADTWCASPGPHGEALYCTDDHAMLPAVLLGRATQYSGTLSGYSKLTVSQRQPAVHAWAVRRVRERWRVLDDGTVVNDRPDGTRSTWRHYRDGTVVNDRPVGDEVLYRTPLGWRLGECDK